MEETLHLAVSRSIVMKEEISVSELFIGPVQIVDLDTPIHVYQL